MNNVRSAWQSATIMTWLVLVVRLVGFAIVMPLALANLPSEEISVWLLFSAIASLQVIFDFGFGPTFSREIAYGFAGRSIVNPSAGLIEKQFRDSDLTEPDGADWSIISAAAGAMSWLYRRAATGAFLLMLTLGTWAAWHPIERTLQPTDAWLAWGAVVLSTTACILGNSYSAFLIGANRIALQKRWEAMASATSLIAQAGALIAGLGLLGLVLAAQAGLLLQVILNRALSRRITRGKLVTVRHPERAPKLLIGEMWPVTWRTAVGSLMSFGLSQGLSVVVANLFVAAEAAGVQVALRVMQVASQISQAPFYSKIPEFNRGQAALERSTHLPPPAGRAMRRSLWIFVLCTILIDIAIRPFLDVIGSGMQFPNHTFWIALSFGVFFERFGGMHVQLLLTKNRAIQHIANTMTGAIWIVAFLALLPDYGTLALPLSMVLAYAGCFSTVSAFISHSDHPANFWSFERRVSIPPLCLLLFYALAYELATK